MRPYVLPQHHNNNTFHSTQHALAYNQEMFGVVFFVMVIIGGYANTRQ